MKEYAMQCTCGHITTVQANSRDEAVKQIQDGMTAEALEAHMKEFHPPSDPVPTLEQSHAMIAQLVQETIPAA